MNEYLKHLERIEFVVTLACTGKCRHCSEGDHETCSGHIDPRIAAAAVGRAARSVRSRFLLPVRLYIADKPQQRQECEIPHNGYNRSVPYFNRPDEKFTKNPSETCDLQINNFRGNSYNRYNRYNR